MLTENPTDIYKLITSLFQGMLKFWQDYPTWHATWGEKTVLEIENIVVTALWNRKLHLLYNIIYQTFCIGLKWVKINFTHYLWYIHAIDIKCPTK